MRIPPITVAGCLVLALAAGPGCKSSAPKTTRPKPGPVYTFNVHVDDSLANHEFRVDLLLDNDSTHAAIEKEDVGEWFKPGNVTRTLPKSKEKYTVTKADRKDRVVTIRGDERYPNYKNLVVIANFPIEVPAGQADPRRYFFPLDGSVFPKAREVSITLTRGGIRADPGPVKK